MRVFRRGARTDARVQTEERIRQALGEVQSLLPVQTVGLELVEFRIETATAVLRVEGDCPDCEMTAAMLLQGIAAQLRMRVPEVREVRAVDAVESRDG